MTNNIDVVIPRIDSDNILRAQMVSNRVLQLIILPTEQCNFRCTYCYEDFSIGRMRKETIQGIKAFIERRSVDLDYLNISWFGGEPLTAKDIVLDISNYAIALASKYHNLRYEGEMTTNGYYLDYPTILNLAKAGVKNYQISLDGPREVHNKSRIRADGSPTFNRIWSNLVAIRDSTLSVSILLRVHFTPDNLELIEPLLEDIRKEFLHDSRFFIFFKAIEPLGSPNDAKMRFFSKLEKEAAVNLLKKKLLGENLEGSTKFSEENNHTICYASRPNSLVIRANGDIGKCTVALNDERNRIGSLKTDGTIELIPGRLTPWLRGIKTLDPAALECPLNNLP